MSIVTEADLKAYLRDEIGTAGEIAERQLALDVADGEILGHCHRGFAVASSATDRTYVPEVDCLLGPHILAIDDCTTVVSVTENGVALVANTDYVKEPVRLTDHAGVARPITQLRRLNGSWYRDRGLGTVVVNSTLGWSAIPAGVKGAARILAKDFVLYRDVQFGLVAMTEAGGVRAREAAIVAKLLAPFVRYDRYGIA